MVGFDWQDGFSGFLNLDGQRLEVSCFGPSPKNSMTIVLLHEGLGSVALWRDFPKLLAEKTGLGVLVYSRFGYGQSDACALPRPLDYMSREAMDVLPTVLAATGINQCILMGHSDGATIAAIYAGMSADHRVRGIVLIAPHFFAEDCGLEAIEKAKQNYDHGDLRARLGKYHSHVDCAFRGWNDAWLDPEFRNWNVAEVIDYLRVPVLAIQGTDDQYGTLAQIEEIEQRIYAPVDVEIFADCGHSPHMEHPGKTLDVVAQFTQRLHRIESEKVLIS